MSAENSQDPHDPGRRSFLRMSGVAAGSAWLAVQASGLLAIAEAAAAARDAGAGFLHLSPREAAGFDAIAARIIPTDATGGAHEAGVVHFIDQALGDFLAGAADDLRAGLASLDAQAMDAHEGERFAGLPPEAQDEALREIETTTFFELMHFLTVAGMFALPAHGGNRDYLGWQLLGLSHRHAWAPPFGHYDAQLADAPMPETGADGEHGHG
jgi:gluconate 2-dehydrogenase gamma chain